MTQINPHRPRTGCTDYVNSRPGFYVVNPTTNIGNERFWSREAAERYIERVYADYPADHAELVIVEIGAGDA